jgi:hypothetical protein
MRWHACNTLLLPAGRAAQVPFLLIAPEGTCTRRARVAVDVAIDDRQWGQQAEALVTVSEAC